MNCNYKNALHYIVKLRIIFKCYFLRLLFSIEIFVKLFFIHLNRAEEITMREDYGNINLDTGGDDGFGDVPGMEVDGEESHTELRASGSLSVDQVKLLI